MSSLSQFTGVRKVAALTNFFSSGTPAPAAGLIGGSGVTKSVNAGGAVTGGVLTTALSVTGRGVLNFVGLTTTDTTSRTLRLKITIDSTVVFDSTSAATTTSGAGIIAIGAGSTTGQVITFQPVRFYTSALVEFASSDTQTNKITCHLHYEVDV